ncbi:MAG: helix-turn-helix domain-containing protein [Thermoproteales archaeon]|nr:helix-turn-helix domain-containing protein [Thermoproteales archaeon]
MSNKDEIEELRKEIEALKEKIKELTKLHEEKIRYIDTGDVENTVSVIAESIIEGIRGEIEKSILIGPHGIYISRERKKIKTADFDEREVAKILDALANENRLKILKVLSTGGRYLKELQEELPDISAGTLSSHLNILQEAGLVVQEAVRGRYLITILGRTALKIVNKLAKLAKQLGEDHVET